MCQSVTVKRDGYVGMLGVHGSVTACVVIDSECQFAGSGQTRVEQFVVRTLFLNLYAQIDVQVTASQINALYLA